MTPSRRLAAHSESEVRFQNGHSAVVVAYALGGAYIGITTDTRTTGDREPLMRWRPPGVQR